MNNKFVCQVGNNKKVAPTCFGPIFKTIFRGLVDSTLWSYQVEISWYMFVIDLCSLRPYVITIHVCMCLVFLTEWNLVMVSFFVLTLRRLMSYIYVEHPFLMFLDHTQWRSTVGRPPLDEWSARPEESYRLCCVVVCDLETYKNGCSIYIWH